MRRCSAVCHKSGKDFSHPLSGSKPVRDQSVSAERKAGIPVWKEESAEWVRADECHLKIRIPGVYSRRGRTVHPADHRTEETAG